MLIEVTLSVGLLLFVSVFMLRTNIQTIIPRNGAMTQALSDAFMTQSAAAAEATPFEDLVATGSPWPVYPDFTATAVTVGTLPNGLAITGRLVQTRQPGADNLPAAGGTGTPTSNPARVESWLVQNHLTYSVGSRTYVKSRNTIRTR